VLRDRSVSEVYQSHLSDGHSTETPVKMLDFWIRRIIGKSDDIEALSVGACSHQAILERERDAQGLDPQKHCRKCGREVPEGVGRCNDFVVLRNPLCRGPICLDCVRDGGDVFYRAFKKGLDEYMFVKGWR